MVVISAVTGPDSSRVLRCQPHINMIPYSVTLYWHQANQPCFIP